MEENLLPIKILHSLSRPWNPGTNLGALRHSSNLPSLLERATFYLRWAGGY